MGNDFEYGLLPITACTERSNSARQRGHAHPVTADSAAPAPSLRDRGSTGRNGSGERRECPRVARCLLHSDARPVHACLAGRPRDPSPVVPSCLAGRPPATDQVPRRQRVDRVSPMEFRAAVSEESNDLPRYIPPGLTCKSRAAGRFFVAGKKNACGRHFSYLGEITYTLFQVSRPPVRLRPDDMSH